MRSYLERLGLTMQPQRLRVTGRRFDPGRTTALVLRGDPRILVSRRIEVDTNLFLGVIVDCSGSMQINGNIEKAKLFATLLTEAARGLKGVDVRVFGFTDSVIYDAGDAVRSAAHDLEADGGNNDAAALWHAAREAMRSRRKARLLVMISDGCPTECSVSALRGLVRKLSVRMRMCCAQVAVRPLEEVTFPHYVVLDEGNLDASVRQFGNIIAGLVQRAIRM